MTDWIRRRGGLCLTLFCVIVLQQACMVEHDSTCDPGCGFGRICRYKECVSLCNEDGDCDVGLERCLKGLCTPFSGIAGCGNKIQEGDEECDDGNSNNSDGCLNDCKLAKCGDTFVFRESGEECDFGLFNKDTGYCTTRCKVSTCGDGYRREGLEACDDGMENSEQWSLAPHCKEDCSGVAPYCGDGVVTVPYETCEPSLENCLSDCSSNDVCRPVSLVGSVLECNVQCQELPITACSGGDGCCPAGCDSSNDSDCTGLLGEIYLFNKVGLQGEGQVKVKVVGNATSTTSESDEIGRYVVSGEFPENSTQLVELIWEQTLGLDGSSYHLPAQFLTRQLVSFGIERPALANLPVVPFKWLVEVAEACGVPNTEATSQVEINGNYIPRTIMVGDLVDSEGRPVVGVPDYAISVSFDGNDFLNNRQDHICFLEQEGENYVGSEAKRSTEAGKFIIFRMKKSFTSNLGNGDATIRVVDYASNVSFETVSINLNAGNVGYVRMVTDDTMPAITEKIDFEKQVMPIFGQRGCNGCHTMGADGESLIRYYVDFSDPDMGVVDSSTTPFKAIWDAEPSEVYGNLTGPGLYCGNVCGNDVPKYEFGITYPRICVNNVDCSLLVVRPLQAGGVHPSLVMLSEEDKDLQTLRAWIAQGASRYSRKDFNTDIMPVFEARNCTTCHKIDEAATTFSLAGNVNQVYLDLLNNADGPICSGVSLDAPKFPFICSDQPLNSKIFQNFFRAASEVGHSGSFQPPEDLSLVFPDVLGVLVWLAEGATKVPNSLSE